MDDDEIKVIAGCVGTALLVVLGPFVLIYALNTLGFAVPLTLKTYVAACFLIAIFR